MMLKAASVAVLVSIGVGQSTNGKQKKTIKGALEQDPDFSTLTAALTAAGLLDGLDGGEALFAPTNEAFEALPDGVLDNLLEPGNKDQLKDILLYHVLPNKFLYKAWNYNDDHQPGDTHYITTLQGQPLSFTTTGGSIGENIKVGPPGALVNLDDNSTHFEQFQRQLGDGQILPIDGVMLPSVIAEQKILIKSTRGTSFVYTQGDCTPGKGGPSPSGQRSDQRAFCDGSGNVYAVTYGSNDGSCSKDRYDGSGVANNELLEQRLTVTPVPFPGTTFECLGGTKQNLVQLCESTPNLSLLTAALVAANLTDTLSSLSEKFTVFAPTDDAFKALPAGVLENLMKPENKDQLADILTYHVLPEQVLSTDLMAFQEVTTVEGKPLHVTVFGGEVSVGPSLLSKDLSHVITADNLATNGVAHIIDGVLLPPQSIMV
jgi:uncharacterized surface protein with fasciclin (FAS1) repeats